MTCFVSSERWYKTGQKININHKDQFYAQNRLN